MTLSNEERRKRMFGPGEMATGHGKNRRYTYFAKHHGMTLKEFNERLEAQGGKCSICRREISIEMKYNGANKAVLDHDHKTNKKRGILCCNCNKGIGLLGDSIETLIEAVVYLKSFE